MRRTRLPWLVSLPLILTGSLSAHAVGYRFVGGHGSEAAAAAEIGGRDERPAGAGHLLIANIPLLLGVIAALALVALAAGAVTRTRDRRPAGPAPAWFLVLPQLSFALQELTERVVHAESFPFNPIHEPTFLVALLLQLPFGIAAFYLARVLVAVGTRLARRILGGARPTVVGGSAARISLPAVAEPHRVALTLGNSERGPPARRGSPLPDIEPLAA